MSGRTDAEATVPLSFLRGAFAMRAAAYAQMFDVLRERFGTDIALELLSESTRRLGTVMGSRFRHLSPSDLPGLKEAFLGGIPAGETLFQPEVRRCDSGRLEIKFHRCPLKEAWDEAGRNPDDVRLLCQAAGAIDGGLFAAAGFTFKGETWKPGEGGCCLLVVEPGKTED